MLTLIEDENEKELAQNQFMKLMRSSWRKKEHREIAWRPSSRQCQISHNGSFWFANVRLDKGEKTPRFWNAVGEYRPNGNLQITVEFNVPIESNTRIVAGFFARDDATKTIYLMHDGSVGGGRRGIGRAHFLEASGGVPVPAYGRGGLCRYGLIVSALETRALGPSVQRFVRSVATFKAGVPPLSQDPGSIDEILAVFADYFPEFSGVKKGQRKRDFEYLSRHGDIVHALWEWRKKRISKSRSDRIVKNREIDLGIIRNNRLVELYEVKTNSSTQTLYTAIGQLMIYGLAGSNTLKRFLVLPEQDQLSAAVVESLRRLKIQVLLYRIDAADNVRILDHRR